MTTSFDPYHRWLSIPPKHQPPDHYRLLSLERFESDPEVIRDAADRQMVHVRSYQLGEYSDLSQKVLNEIATARVCLLNPEKKAAYDERLREQLVGQQAVGVPGTSHAAVVPAISTESRSSNIPRRIWPVLGGVAGVLVLGLLIWQFAGRGRPPVSEPPRIARKEPPEAPKPPPLPPPAPPQMASTVAESSLEGNSPAKPVPLGLADVPGIKSSYAKVQVLSGGEFVRLIDNAAVDTSGRTLWSKIPHEFEGLHFLRNRHHAGTLEFRVTEPGLVIMAVTTRWGGGGRGGDWQKEIFTRKALLADQWQEVGQLHSRYKNEAPEPWIVFRKLFKNRTSASIRTEKYLAPVLLLKPDQGVHRNGQPPDHVAPVAEKPTPIPEPPQMASTVAQRKGSLDVSELGRDNETEQPDADAEVALAAPSEDMSPAATDERKLGDLLKEPEDMAVSPAESDEPAKSPVPERSEQEEVRSMLDEAYDTTRPRAPDEKLKLAGQLASMAEKAENPTERFVLLRRASELATEGGDAAKMLGLVARIADEFEVDQFLAQAHMLNQIATTARSEEHIGGLVQSSADLIDAAMAADRFDLADSLSAAVYRATMEPAGRSFRVEALNRRRKVQQQRDLWSEVQEARNTLQTNPQDDEAHTRIAQWYCFVRGDWEKALLHFAKGSHAGLSALAHRELEDSPQDVAGRVELADAWWDLAQTREEPSQSAFLWRAAYWYKQAQPQLTSPLVKAKVAKRLAELAGVRPPGTQPAPPLAVAPFDARQARSHQEAWAKYLGVPVVVTNSIGMEFAIIPPGEFMMGSTASFIAAERGRTRRYRARVDSEGPQHRLRITRPFGLGIYEVTQAQFRHVMGNNPSRFKDNPVAPVEQVTWHEAVEFCRRLSQLPPEKSAGVAYRLPTEAEWEYACRAGTTTRYSFGDDGPLEEYAWYQSNADGRTQPVGRLRPNDWGLYDMHGNVLEWCVDWFDNKYDGTSRADDPLGPHTGSARVLRGGHWTHSARYSRSAVRFWDAPDSRNSNHGFRVVLVLPQSARQGR